MFSVVCDKDIKPESIKPGEKIYLNTTHFLPFDRFLPKKGEKGGNRKQQNKGGNNSGRGGRGGGRGGRGGRDGRGRGFGGPGQQKGGYRPPRGGSSGGYRPPRKENK